jgi:hypothetical protein
MLFVDYRPIRITLVGIIASISDYGPWTLPPTFSLETWIIMNTKSLLKDGSMQVAFLSIKLIR